MHQPFTELFATRQFQAGLVAGGLVLVGVLAVSAVRQQRRHGRGGNGTPEPLGAAFVVASLAVIGGDLGFGEIRAVPAAVPVALALLGVGGATAARTRRPWLVGPIAALPGGVLLAASPGTPGGAWVRALLIVGPALGGATAADLDRRGQRLGLAPLFVIIAVGAAYTTVPDTELARALVGVALPVTFLAWPRAVGRLGGGGAYAVIGLFLWVVAIEGVGRPGSVVGAVGCLGLLVVEPIGRLARRRVPRVVARSDRSLQGVAVCAQVVVALYAARVAGFQPRASDAAWLLIPAVAVSLALGAGLGISDPSRSRHRHRLGPNGQGSQRRGARGESGSAGHRRLRDR